MPTIHETAFPGITDSLGELPYFCTDESAAPAAVRPHADVPCEQQLQPPSDDHAWLLALARPTASGFEVDLSGVLRQSSPTIFRIEWQPSMLPLIPPTIQPTGHANRVALPHVEPVAAMPCAKLVVAPPSVALLWCEGCKAPLIPGVQSLICVYCFIECGHDLVNSDAAQLSINDYLQAYADLIRAPPCARCVSDDPKDSLVSCCTNLSCPAGPCQLMRATMHHSANARDLVHHVYTGISSMSDAARLGRWMAKSAQKCRHGRMKDCAECGGRAQLCKQSANASRMNLRDWVWLEPALLQLPMFNADASFVDWFARTLGKRDVQKHSTSTEHQVGIRILTP